MRALFSLLCLTFILSGCGGNSSNSAPGTSGGVISGPTSFAVTAPSAPGSYTVDGINNATLTLQRGTTYTFNLNVSGHPFFIMSVQGTNTANAFSDGVTGNGNQ